MRTSRLLGHAISLIAMLYCSTRTYYRGTDAVVTDQLFVWLTKPTRGYVVRDLRSVGLVRTKANRLRSYALHVASGMLVLAVATWMTLESPAAYALGALAVAMPSVFAVARMRTRPQRWEIRATYRGTRVLLYTSPDVRVSTRWRGRCAELWRTPAPSEQP